MRLSLTNWMPLKSEALNGLKEKSKTLYKSFNLHADGKSGKVSWSMKQLSGCAPTTDRYKLTPLA